MKAIIISKSTILRTIASTALLMACVNINAAPPENSNSPKNGGGASIGISNSCWIDGTNPAILSVETTITDKTILKDSGAVKPIFTSAEVVAQEKIRNKVYPLTGPLPANVNIDALNATDADPVTGQYPPFVTEIDLCAAGLSMDATAVNANLRIQVFNSNKSFTNSKCSAKYEDGLSIGGMALCQ